MNTLANLLTLTEAQIALLPWITSGVLLVVLFLVVKNATNRHHYDRRGYNHNHHEDRRSRYNRYDGPHSYHSDNYQRRYDLTDDYYDLYQGNSSGLVVVGLLLLLLVGGLVFLAQPSQPLMANDTSTTQTGSPTATPSSSSLTAVSLYNYSVHPSDFATPNANSVAGAVPLIYTVRKGDTLAALSRVYHTSVAALTRANSTRLTSVNQIYPNTRLVIPVGQPDFQGQGLITTQATTLTDLARQYNLDPTRLANLNHVEQTKTFKPNEAVLLP